MSGPAEDRKVRYLCRPHWIVEPMQSRLDAADIAQLLIGRLK